MYTQVIADIESQISFIDYSLSLGLDSKATRTALEHKSELESRLRFEKALIDLRKDKVLSIATGKDKELIRKNARIRRERKK
jgi:hypothetical protein